MNTIPSAKECATHGVKCSLEAMIKITGIGFHPDTDFNDYINKSTKRRSFSKREAKIQNSYLNECFALSKKYDLDIYGLTIEVMKPYLKAAFNEA